MTDDTIEVGEATMAVASLTAVLKGEMPKIGVGLQKEIVGLDKKIDALAQDFVYDRLPKKLSMPRPFTYRQLLDTFTKPIPASSIAEIPTKFPPDAGDAAISFLSTLQRAYASLAEIVPVADYNTYLGPKHIMPTSDKTFDFFLRYWVVDQPLVVFQLMQMGALMPEQVDSLKELFPSLHNYMTAAILNALIGRNHREASFVNLPPRADRGLATFKQQRIVEYGTNIHELAPKPMTPPANPVTPKIPATLQTAGQKVAGL